MKKNPSVSVIIPLYNAEKYIAECLESILIQTFQDFEVIVVDDCSTDNSCAIVENYSSKFNGRLRLYQTEKNSGGAGYVPRNIGLDFSRGEYIFFMDADDVIDKIALEKLFAAAKNFDVEVVYTSSCYTYNAAGTIRLVKDSEGEFLAGEGLADELTLIIDNSEENLQRLLFKGNFRTPWSKFIRRDFLLKNKITFPEITSGGDFLWTIHVFCCAKKFLRLPEAFYVYRVESVGSVTRKKRSPEKQIAYWLKSFILWSEALDALSNELEILKKNPFYCYMATDQHFDVCFKNISEERLQTKSYEVYEILQRELADKGGAIPYFFNVIDAQQKFSITLQERIAELENELKRKD